MKVRKLENNMKGQHKGDRENKEVQRSKKMKGRKEERKKE